MCVFHVLIDGDVEKPQAKKRRTEDPGSAKGTQNGKKRKREEENEVCECLWWMLHLVSCKTPSLSWFYLDYIYSSDDITI